MTSALALCFGGIAVADSAIAVATKEAAVLPTVLDVDWEATGDLLYVELPAELAAPTSAQIRIHQGEEPLFFEELGFAAPQIGATLSHLHGATRALRVLAYQPDERAWLLDALRTASPEDALTYGVRIDADDQLVYDGTLLDLVNASDALRQAPFAPHDSKSHFVDLRPAVRPASHTPFKNLCIEDCFDEYQNCQVDFCYWDYDQYMCDIGCDEELAECEAIADPNCEPPPPPTCTPGVISTDTSTQIVGAQFQGLDCMGFFNPSGNGEYFTRYYLTYETTTTETRRRADCSTYTQVVGVTTSYGICHSFTGAPCSFGFGFPSCLF